MFGRNVLMKVDRGDGQELLVQSVFPTIQGEGPFVGTPAFFIRLAGCNLRCHFCDTDFESKAERIPIHTIYETIHKPDAREAIGFSMLVVITGGEPLRQNVVPLVSLLLMMGYDVQFETAGTVWPDGLESLIVRYANCTLVCSPKTGGVHPMITKLCSHYKYIVNADDIFDPDTGAPFTATQQGGERVRLAFPEGGDATIWMQPCEEYNHSPVGGASIMNKHATHRNVQAAVALCMKHGHRLSYQLHKAIGLP